MRGRELSVVQFRYHRTPRIFDALVGSIGAPNENLIVHLPANFSCRLAKEYCPALARQLPGVKLRRSAAAVPDSGATLSGGIRPPIASQGTVVDRSLGFPERFSRLP